MLDMIARHVENDPRYAQETLRDYGVSLLRGTSHLMGFSNIPDSHFLPTVEGEIWADAGGTHSHGLNLLGNFAHKLMLSGKIDPTKTPERMESKYPSIGQIDGRGIFGHLASMEAVAYVKELARKYGTALVSVHNANHNGAAGYWSHMIAEDGDLSGFVTCTAAAGVVMHGGVHPVLGTNPIAWSMPYHGGTLNHDAATAVNAINYVYLALKGRWEKLPFTVGYLEDDGSISYTNDPAKFNYSKEVFNERGRALPHGSTMNPDENRGYKGAGLSYMITAEGVMAGGPTGVISSVVDERGPDDLEVLMFRATAIDYDHPINDHHSRIAAMNLDYVTKTGGSDVFIPGELEETMRKVSAREGVRTPQENIAEFREMARGYANMPPLESIRV